MRTHLRQRFPARTFSAVCALFLSLGLGTSALAEPVSLFDPDWAGIAADGEVSGSTVRARYTQVQSDVIATSTGTMPVAVDAVQMTFFADADFTVVHDRTVQVSETGFVWYGHVENHLESPVVLSCDSGVITGNARHEGRVFEIRYDTDAHVIAEVDEDQLPGCGGQLAVDPNQIAADTAQAMMASDAIVAADDGLVIDVMFVYTGVARAEAGGVPGMRSLINLAVANANYALEQSAVNHRVRLVYSDEVAYDETNMNWDTTIARLRDPNDGYMDEAHAWRDTYCADVVHLVVKDPTYCGIGYLMGSLSSGFESWAFGMDAVGCLANFTFAHELGHNMGSHHDLPNTSGSNSALYPYSFGWNSQSAGFATVMSYLFPCTNEGPNVCWRVGHFSNPAIWFNGVPTGVAETADNARSLNNAAFTAANWRQSCATCSPDDAEDDDNGGSARVIQPDQPVSRSICDPADEDWFTFSLTYPTGIVLETNGGWGDTVMTLYDGNLLAMELDDDGGNGLWASIDRVCGTDELQPGTYYARVQSRDGNIVPEYTMELTLQSCGPQSCPPDPGEAGDAVPITSMVLQSGVPVTRALCPVADHDWAQFTLDKTSTVVLETTGVSGDTHLTLMSGSNLSVVASDNDSGSGSFSRIERTCEVDALPPGKYYVDVIAIDGKDIPQYTLHFTATECIVPATDVTVTADVSSPQPFDTPVAFTASASGGSGNYEYQFWQLGPGTHGQWTIAQAFSTASTYPWTPGAADVGTTTFRVWAKSVGSPNVRDVMTDTTFTIETRVVPAATSVTVVPDRAGPYATGTSVTLTAAASGGATPYEYQFWKVGPGTGGGWVVAQPYSTGNTYTWSTASADVGDTTFRIWAKSQGSANVRDVMADLVLTVSGSSVQSATAVTLTPDVGPPYNSGETVTFTAAASGGTAPYEYQFWQLGPGTGGAWTIARTYDTTPTYTWTPTSADVGDTTFRVWTKSQGSANVRDVWAEGVFTTVAGGGVQPATAVTVVPDSGGPHSAGNTVTFTAAASGGTAPYEYQFWQLGPGTNGAWVIARAYNTTATYAWTPTSADVGDTTFRVWAKSQGSANVRDVWSEQTLTVSASTVLPATGVTLAPDIAGPHTNGDTVTLTAAASGGTGPYEYQFWQIGPGTGGAWVLLQPFSADATYAWSPTSADVGTTTFRVWAKAGGSANTRDVIADLNLIVSP